MAYPTFYTTVEGLDFRVVLGDCKHGSNQLYAYVRHTFLRFECNLFEQIPASSLEHARKSIVHAFEDSRYTFKFKDEERNRLLLEYEFGALGDKKLTYKLEFLNFKHNTNYALEGRGFDKIKDEHTTLKRKYDELDNEYYKFDKERCQLIVEHDTLKEKYITLREKYGKLKDESNKWQECYENICNKLTKILNSHNTIE